MAFWKAEFVIVAMMSSAAWAGEAKAPRPQVVAKLVECRALVADAARLACYDREVAAFDTAEKNRDVIVVDRAQVGKARRTLFGLTLPDFDIFSRGETKEEKAAFTQIETTITLVSSSDGNWLITLEGGARWLQTDSVQMASRPKPGDRIRIRKGALGSFLANVNGQRAIRVRRLN